MCEMHRISQVAKLHELRIEFKSTEIKINTDCLLFNTPVDFNSGIQIIRFFSNIYVIHIDSTRQAQFRLITTYMRSGIWVASLAVSSSINKVWTLFTHFALYSKSNSS